jgi:hypothetical protein
MGKALIAVGTFLTACMLIFGGVVYFTRHENTYAVDSQLSEAITLAIAQAENQPDPVDLRVLARFDFDRVLIFAPGTPRALIDRALGFKFLGQLRYTVESSEILVFTNRGRFVRFADYRGRARWAGLTRPLDYLTANDAVFRVEQGVVRPS